MSPDSLTLNRDATNSSQQRRSSYQTNRRKFVNDFSYQNFAALKKTFDCEMITPMMQTKGKIDIYPTHIVFTRDPKYEEGNEEEASTLSATKQRKKGGMDTKNLLKRPSSKQWGIHEVIFMVVP